MKAADEVKVIEPARVADSGFTWRTMEATVPTGTPVEHLLSGQFWRLIAPGLSRGDRISWRDDQLKQFGELAVVGCDHQTSTLDIRLLWHVDV